MPLPNNLTPAEFIPEARSRNGVDALPITEDDALQLGKLPTFHQDPFDRMLICQAIANQAMLVTPDPLIARYPVSVQWSAARSWRNAPCHGISERVDAACRGSGFD